MKACCPFYASLFKKKGPSKKGLFLNSGENLFGCVWFFTRSLLLVCTHRMKQDGFFASDSKYVVCFKYNFCPEKVFVTFFLHLRIHRVV